jgi:hypothetical protein
MSMGAILERVDYEMGKVLDNILDPNTKATGKRKIKASIVAYFEEKLAEEITGGKVVVMM